MSSFKALMVHRDDEGVISHVITDLQHGDLPVDGDVLVKVKYSTVNYKDGQCLLGIGRLVRNYPHVLVLILLARLLVVWMTVMFR